MTDERGVLLSAGQERAWTLHLDEAVPVDPVTAVPLKDDGAPRGAVVLGRLATRAPFDQTDLEMVAAYAEQAALALEMAGTRASQLTPVLGVRPEVHLVGPLDTLVEDPVADDVEAVVREALSAVVMGGASGYLLKEMVGSTLLEDVRQVARADPLVAGLTAQELEIVDPIADGCTNRQIRERMFLAGRTVKNYVTSVLLELGVQRRIQAAVFGSTVRLRAADRAGVSRPTSVVTAPLG